MSTTPAVSPDPYAPMRSKAYIQLLVIAALIGIPVSVVAFFFLALTGQLQTWLFTDVPAHISSHTAATWWPLIPLTLAGLIVGLVIKYLPGKGGEMPIEGFKAGGLPIPANLPGIAIASLASIGLGAVVGPEGPLIAIGGGLAYWAVKQAKKDLPNQAGAMIAASGSFAAISALLGSPLLGAFLMMEAAGLGGATMEMVLIPGLLSAGIGYLIFLGLGSLTGLGTLSLAIPNLPHIGAPTITEFGWAIVVGLVAPLVIRAIRWLGFRVKPYASRFGVGGAVMAGVIVALLAIGYSITTGDSSTNVLYSGESSLGPLIVNASSFPVWTLVLLIVLKGLSYGISLSSFRGGPTFPAMFIGAALGIAMSHLPGLSLVPAIAIGMGAMTVSMLKFPLVSILLATLLLSSDGLDVMPLVIVAVVIAYVVTIRLSPAPQPAPAA
ncbi:chloride channel protein [Candidatus Saccharibacteria bacterium]|nr:chloride channel protein [Candidatus Saccharibacteria bacterium]